MQKQITRLETEVDEIKFTFDCAPKSTLDQVLNALNQMRAYVIGKSKEVEEMRNKLLEKQEEEKEDK